MFNKIGFPGHQGLPFNTSPPTVDGYTEPHPGMPVSSWRLEAGYVGGARFSYAGSGAAFPAASFQGVKDSGAGFLHLAFDVRFDPSFNNSDRVMIILRPAFAAGSSTADRRIDILPVFSGAGGAAAAPVSTNDLASANYRTDRPPRALEVYRRNPTSPTPASVWNNVSASVGPNLQVKVSSSAPTSTAKSWTVELRIPTTAAGGGADWVDITNDFGLYINMIRVCSGAGCSGPLLDGLFSTQFTWPFDPANPSAFLLTDALMGGPKPVEDWDVPAATLGEALIVPAGNVVPGVGVKFKNGLYSIGVLAGGAIGGTLRMTPVGTVNDLVAELKNEHPTDTASGLEAEFRIADFGLGPYGNASLWRKTPSSPNPAAATGSIAPGATTTITSQWIATAADKVRYSGIWSDECLWVDIDSSAGASIAESSQRRNLTVVTASEDTGVASVSGDIPDTPADAVEFDYWLHSAVVRLEELSSNEPPFQGRREGDDDHRERPDPEKTFDLLDANPLLTGQAAYTGKSSATWLWVNTGYWRTPEVLTIDGDTYAIWANTGSFGSVVHHFLPPGQTPQDVDILTDIAGRGVKSTGPGGYLFRLPPKTVKRLWIRVLAGDKEELSKGFGKLETEEPPEPPKVRDDPYRKPGGYLQELLDRLRKLFQRPPR
jgi:hypothetical protein